MDIKKQLMRDEGKVRHAYNDHLGYLTIGIGFLIDERKGGGIPEVVMDFWLEYEINQRRAALKQALPFFDSLNEARQGALINMAYQMGVKGVLGFKETLRHFANGDYDLASKEALNSLWARETPERAKRISKQIKTGVWQ